MKKILLILLFFPTFLFAQNSKISTGLFLGTNIGIVGKYKLQNQYALDAGISFNNDLTLWGDYLIHFPKIFGSSSEFVEQLLFYLGGGAYIGFHDSDHKHRFGHKNEGNHAYLGIRVPIGIEWSLPHAPFTVGVEIIPIFNLIPYIDAGLQGGILLRYRFQ